MPARLALNHEITALFRHWTDVLAALVLSKRLSPYYFEEQISRRSI
jgi:hypothetical protein